MQAALSNTGQAPGGGREYHRRGIPVSVVFVGIFSIGHQGDLNLAKALLLLGSAGHVVELSDMGMRLMVSITAHS